MEKKIILHAFILKVHYIQHNLPYSLCMYCRSVVFNYRGCGNTRLSTPIMYCIGRVDDLAEVIGHIKQRYPKSPLMAVGTSFGGYALNTYDLVLYTV